MSRNAPNCSLKKDVINGYGFLAICLPKIDYLPENQHAICLGIVLLHILRFFENIGNFRFWKKLYKNLSFSFLGESKKRFLENPR